ncbi:MAG: radical SAM family heme chaperone HemW [Parashewanella sp.]
MLSLPPLSLYIHIPWCVQKCPYCDFNSHGQKGVLPESEYIEALLKDLQQDIEYVQGRKLHSIFIGGGTPSLFSAAGIAKILDGVRQHIPFADDIEITMEANPGTLEHDAFTAYRQAGVNRLSIGIQSFSKQKLNLLGRIHDEDEAEFSASNARQAGYNSFNLDLMHGLPDQSFEEAMFDIEKAASLQPPHLSWYQLTIEQNTLFHSKPPQLPDDESLWQIYVAGKNKLESLGYQQYEISAYAKEGYQCRHNLNYWQFGDYLGIGCGAHGKITLPDQNQIIRTEKIKHPKGYLSTDDFTSAKTQVKKDDRALEYLMNRFRLISPIPKTEFEQRTGLDHSSIAEGIEKAKQKLLLTESENHWQLTNKGQMFVNELLAQFC